MKHGEKRPVRTREAFLLPETFLFLGLARLLTMAMKFNQFSRILGIQGSREPKAPDAAQLERAREVASVIAQASRRAPWKTRCLVRAIAAQLMLKRRRINSTLSLGVARSGNKPLKAHAWVKCGDVFLTGERPAMDYTVVAMFSNEFDNIGPSGGEDSD
jgi:hypothetical protein